MGMVESSVNLSLVMAIMESTVNLSLAMTESTVNLSLAVADSTFNNSLLMEESIQSLSAASVAVSRLAASEQQHCTATTLWAKKRKSRADGVPTFGTLLTCYPITICNNFHINLLFDTSIMIFTINNNDTNDIRWSLLLRNFRYFIMVELWLLESGGETGHTKRTLCKL